MPGILLSRPTKLAFSLLCAIAVGGCEEIVYVERPPFNPPPDLASGFLGYFNAETKQTTCGNCHADFQASWMETAHAAAWATLDAEPSKQASCNGCHTVSERGNTLSTAAGYNAVAHDAYHDVQCENCHGPGLQHIEGVGQGQLIRPLAKISMLEDANCGECHSGIHQPFAEEWAQSAHAGFITSPASRSPCNTCHDGRATLVAWGVDHNYVERDQPSNYQPVACAVCHNPHGSPSSKQLRFAINSPDPALNLCMKCHLRRDEPEDARPTPHGPQGGVLLGQAGYRPAVYFAYDSALIFGTHATDRNPKLCAGCHVGRFTVTDAATGNFAFQSTGHLFRPIPCLDAQGKPTGDDSCAYTATARSWRTCTTSGCHGSAAAAANVFNGARDRLESLAAVIWVDTDNDESVEATDQGYLAILKATRAAEWGTNLMVTPAEGGEFNVKLCGPERYENGDGSNGAHNIFLCQALLQASINQLKAVYGLPAPPAEVQELLDRLRGGANAGAVAGAVQVSYNRW